MADYCIDIAAFFEEVSAEEVCGPNLEYDPDFLELEQEYRGKAEVQFGDVITPATDPDWSLVKRLSIALLERSRDLRPAVALSRALLRLEGISGFLTGLALIEGLLEQRWETVHPQLDPDDDYDPLLRINTLSALCDALSFLKDVREATLVSSRGYGRFSLRDIDAATGEHANSTNDDDDNEQQGITLSVIDAAFMDAPLDELEAILQQLQDTLNTSRHIEQLLTEQVGVSHSIDLSALVTVLRRACHFVQERLERRTGGQLNTDTDSDSDASLGEEGAVSSSASARSVAMSDSLSSREDVVRTLDKLCEYYARHEPSSPVPLLLLRAKALVNKSFIEILEDLAPDGLDQVYQISRSRSDS